MGQAAADSSGRYRDIGRSGHWQYWHSGFGWTVMEVSTKRLASSEKTGYPSISDTSLSVVSILPEIEQLWSVTIGDPEICVAILDGPVDMEHPCFTGARLKRLETLRPDTLQEDAAKLVSIMDRTIRAIFSNTESHDVRAWEWGFNQHVWSCSHGNQNVESSGCHGG
jgi:hypothetical protein